MSMTFEDLESWKKSREMVNAIYAMTRDAHLTRDYGLCSQIQRAAVSVMSNLAEGFERQHVPEKIQAYNIARASCGEVRSLLYVIEDNYPDRAGDARKIRQTAIQTGALVSGLITSTRKRLASKIAGIGTGIGLAVGLSLPLLTTLS